MFDKDMLKSILAAYGPSGREQTVSDVIRSYVEPFADEVYNDTLGNLIAVKKGASGKKVMLSAIRSASSLWTSTKKASCACRTLAA